MKEEKQVFMFLLAFFFYIDGVYTIIDMATAYGSALGLDSTGLLLALLVTQIVAFPCAIIFIQDQNREADYCVYLCLSGDCYFCSLSEDTAPVLDPCNSRRNVSGRDPGAFKIIFYQDHSGGAFG